MIACQVSSARCRASSAALLSIAVGVSCSSSSTPASRSLDGSFDYDGATTARKDSGHPVDAKSGVDSGHRKDSAVMREASGGNDSAAPEASAHEAGTCNSVALAGSPVGFTNQVGSAPSPAGGVIVPGPYQLVERDVYGPDASGGMPAFVQRTMTFTSSGFEQVEADGDSDGGPVGPSTTSSYVYHVSSIYLFSVTEICPLAHQVSLDYFSVVTPDTGPGPQIWLFPEPGYVEIYAPE